METLASKTMTSDSEFIEQFAASKARSGEQPFFVSENGRKFAKFLWGRCFRLNFYSVEENKVVRSAVVEVIGGPEDLDVAVLNGVL